MILNVDGASGPWESVFMYVHTYYKHIYSTYIPPSLYHFFWQAGKRSGTQRSGGNMPVSVA